MAKIQNLQDEMSRHLTAASYRLYTADQELESRFARSPTGYMESPLEKPLPPLPTPIDNSTSRLQPLSSGHQKHPLVRTPVFVNANDVGRQRQFNTSHTEHWIDSSFAGNDVHFGAAQNGYAWKLGRRLYEKSDYSSTESYATALYECSQIKGRVRGPKALMKIYLQIPSYCNTCEQMCWRPSAQSKWISQEIAMMKRMSQCQGQVPAPRLLATKTKIQGRQMSVPGGYLTFIVMQQLPGSILDYSTFWSLPTRIRDEVRISFRRALQNLWQRGILPHDCGLEKISWDPVQQKCYVIDLRGAEPTGSPTKWFDFEYFKWGLSSSTTASLESPRSYSTSTADMINNKINYAIEQAAMRDPAVRYQADIQRYELAASNG